MRVAAAVLALATSVCALTVTFPDNSTGWSDNGSNVVKWTRVSSDATNFTVVLVNQQVFPPYSQVLNALVDAGSDGGSVTVNPPSSGWPAKGQAGYQVNLATSAERTDALLAQSQPFGFHDPTSSSSASGSSVSVVSPSTFVASNTASSSDATPTDSTGSQTSDTPTPPPNTNSAANTGVQAVLFGLVALAGAILA